VSKLDSLSGMMVQNREVNTMQELNVKSTAHELIEQLPDNVSWSQLAYHVEVRASIERGLDDARAGRFCSTDEVKERLGIK